MPQLHLYVPEDVAAELRARAEARGLSVSELLRELVQAHLPRAWPERFFEEVIGGWSGPPLERGDQGKPESRESFITPARPQRTRRSRRRSP